MTVFISCSGSLSKKVAELLHSWLQDVIQGLEPWVYSEDIEKGALWPQAVDKALATTVGILCVTQENKSAPWLLFEAGGLFKGLEHSRVCPLLIDLEAQDVKQPLARFTFTFPNKEDMWKLLKTINHADPEKELREDRLQKSFDRVWHEFEKPFQKIREAHKKDAKEPQRTTDDMIIEILKIIRELQRNSEEQRQLLAKPTTPMPGDSWADFGKKPELNPRSFKLIFDSALLAQTAELEKKIKELSEREKTISGESPKPD